MTIRRKLQSWLSWFPWYRRRARGADLERELRDHLELEAEEQTADGLSPQEAAYAAHRALGNTLKIEEDVRAAWGFQWFETFVQDVRYAFRMLRKSPGFTAVAVLTLALGTGANTAIFSLIDTVMLKMLPVKNPEQLVLLSWVSQEYPAGLRWLSESVRSDATGRLIGLAFSYPSFEAFQKGVRVFSSFFGFEPFGMVNISAEGRANVAEEELVSGDYFSGLGVAPILGRAITSEDENTDAPGVAVISYGLWSRHFGRSPEAVGKGITINGVPSTVIGVAPPQFLGVTPGRAVDVWVPLVQNSKLLPWTAFQGSESASINSPTHWWVEMMDVSSLE
jgi:hypothetical protein